MRPRQNLDRSIRSASVLGIALTLALAGCRQNTPAPTPEAVTPEAVPTAPPPTAPAPPRDGGFGRMDRNSDRRISAAEHTEGAATMFASMDADGTGNVTPAEMDKAQAAVQGNSALSSADKIKAVDRNGDGLLSKSEHVAGATAMFGMMDTDGDGSLSAAEFKTGHEALLGD